MQPGRQRRIDFDPMGISSSIVDISGDLNCVREAEIALGRLAMIATVNHAFQNNEQCGVADAALPLENRQDHLRLQPSQLSVLCLSFLSIVLALLALS